MLKKANLKKLIIPLDIIGFAIIFVGAALIRFAKDEVSSILGGFVLAGGVALLGITRLIKT